MKRTDLLRHLRRHECYLLREGKSHSWWRNGMKDLHSAVPRHREINELLAQKICRDLGIPVP